MFTAFVRLAACVLAAGTREPVYLEEAKHWKPEELELFAQALGVYVNDAEAEPLTAPPRRQSSLKAMLEEAPEPEAKMLFEHLLAEGAGLADGRALRTFQRRVVGLSLHLDRL